MTSSAIQQPNVQYNSQKETVTIQQDIDAMYDVVQNDTSKTNPPPPVAEDGPQAGYDVLHSSTNKVQTTEKQPQQTLPTAEYAVINKSYASCKITPREIDSPREQSSDTKSKQIKKQKKGKKKKSQEAQLDAPPPIPPQMYLNQEELLPSQDTMQQTSQSESADALHASKNEDFSCYPDSMYDVVKQ